jgi:hypothetical protein
LLKNETKKGQEPRGKGNDGPVSRVPGDAGTHTWQTLEEMDKYKETSPLLLLII